MIRTYLLVNIVQQTNWHNLSNGMKQFCPKKCPIHFLLKGVGNKKSSVKFFGLQSAYLLNVLYFINTYINKNALIVKCDERVSWLYSISIPNYKLPSLKQVISITPHPPTHPIPHPPINISCIYSQSPTFFLFFLYFP